MWEQWVEQVSQIKVLGLNHTVWHAEKHAKSFVNGDSQTTKAATGADGARKKMKEMHELVAEVLENKDSRDVQETQNYVIFFDILEKWVLVIS